MKEGMIDIKNRKCNCGKHQPNFGFFYDLIPNYCSECKEDNMIDIMSNKCGCGKNPTFGFSKDKNPSYCKDCKSKDMIDLKHRKCKCGYGFPIGRGPASPTAY